MTGRARSRTSNDAPSGIAAKVVRDLYRARPLASSLGSPITDQVDHALDVAHVLAGALDPSLAPVRGPDLDPARALARALDLAPDRVLDFSVGRDPSCVHGLVHAVDRELELALDLTRTLRYNSRIERFRLRLAELLEAQRNQMDLLKGIEPPTVVERGATAGPATTPTSRAAARMTGAAVLRSRAGRKSP